MAESKPNEHTQEMPRRVSITQKLLGNSRELFTSFYSTQESEDQMYGLGFNDQAEEMIPAFMHHNAMRRRNSSVSSEGSVEGVDMARKSSITDRIAGMQLLRKPTDKVEGLATTIASCVDDQ